MSPGDTRSPATLLTGGVVSGSAAALRQDGAMRSAWPEHVTTARGRDRALRFPPLYRLLRLGCAPLLRWLFDLRVTGVDHLPETGPFIVAANHHNYVDGVVLGVALPRPIAFVVMPRVFNASPLHPLLHRWIGSIQVSLERPDPGAIRRVLRVLESGRVIGIFPEGPFSREGRLCPGQPGVAMIALRSGMPVVPAAIDGTYEALAGRRFHVPRRYPLSVRFGAPMLFGRARHGRITRTDRADVTRRIMAEIAALLGAERTRIGASADRAGTS
jgi:1-acyl-sn-glycerol-3-phosphate acyltransferase